MLLITDCRHIIALAVSDLRFEWILSLCMVLALGAVFTPLFILQGLQKGIVGNMLDELQRDPVSRVVTPKYPLRNPLSDEWLEGLRLQSDFVISTPTSHLLLDVEGLSDPINTIPTAIKDPLMSKYGITLTEHPLLLVISQRLAQTIDKKTGDTVTLLLIRNTGREERVPIKFRVAGVLPTSVTDDRKIWLPTPLFQGFYKWRKGQAFPELGLAGQGSQFAPEFDGMLTLLEKVPSPEEYRRMLAGKISFSQLPTAISKMGWKNRANHHIQLWKPVNNRLFKSVIAPLRNRHYEQGYPIQVVPYIENFTLTFLSNKEQQELILTILPEMPKLEVSTDVPSDYPTAWVATDNNFSKNEIASISFTSGLKGKQLTVPVRVAVSPMVESGHIALPSEFAGKMNVARAQEASYDPTSAEFTPSDAGVRFFRAYAKTIDELEALVESIRQEGEKQAISALREPQSRITEVRKIKQLANYMEQLYLLILIVAGISGFFAILANVYAGIERKRRDLAYLQLLGMHPVALFLFPCLKSLLLVLGSVLAALIAYSGFGYISDSVFAHLLGDTASLTRLTTEDIFILTTGILSIALVASLAASTAVTRIEPAEYIRE